MKLTLIKTAAVALVSASLLAVPAQAGGALSITLTPNGSDAEMALRAGLAIFGIAQDMQANGGITQTGTDNIAGLLQNGSGNVGVIHQDGSGHEGTLMQSGSGNAYGLFQFGHDTQAHVEQAGHGQSGLTFQFGF